MFNSFFPTACEFIHQLTLSVLSQYVLTEFGKEKRKRQQRFKTEAQSDVSLNDKDKVSNCGRTETEMEATAVTPIDMYKKG